MKHFIKFSVLLLTVGTLLYSCKKEKVKEPQFDIKNPAGYLIAGTFDVLPQGNNIPVPIVFEFLSNQKVRAAYIDGMGEVAYGLSNDTILVDGMKLLIKDNKVIHFAFGTYEPATYNLKLLKRPGTNALSGNTYTGTYYNTDRSVLHPQFFYGFNATENKVDAGYTVGTTVRTETYTNLANIAALVVGNGFREFMLLDDGTLKVMYRQDGGSMKYGTLNP